MRVTLGILNDRCATAGFDMSIFTDQTSFSYMGVAFSERLYFVLEPFLIVQPVLVMMFVAFLCGLWPAWKAARIDPAPMRAPSDDSTTVSTWSV